MKRRLRWINLVLMLGLLFGALGFMPAQAAAQNRAVEPGDIAMILMNVDDEDSIAFVVLANIPADTVFYFTDSGWISSENKFRMGEGAFTYTVPEGGLSAGTIIYRDGPWTGTALSAPWTVANDSFVGTDGAGFSISGDQVLAFIGTTASPSFIYALNNDGAGVWQADATSSNNSGLPTGLVNGTTAVALNEIDNAKLNCTGNISGTKAQLLAYISNNANWVGSNDARQSIDAGCSFTVSNPTASGPGVSSTTPADEATMIALNSDIQIYFTEPVTLAVGWFKIDCSVSGDHSAVVSHMNPTFILNPDSDFAYGEVCIVTIFADKVTDYFPPGLPTQMEEDHVFSLSTLALPMSNKYFLPLIVK